MCRIEVITLINRCNDVNVLGVLRQLLVLTRYYRLRVSRLRRNLRILEDEVTKGTVTMEVSKRACAYLLTYRHLFGLNT